MKVTVFLTLLCIAACILGIDNPGVSILAILVIYFVWKAYDFNQANEKLQKDLEEVKSLLQLQNETNANVNVKNEETQISTAEDITASGNSENGTT